MLSNDFSDTEHLRQDSEMNQDMKNAAVIVVRLSFPAHVVIFLMWCCVLKSVFGGSVLGFDVEYSIHMGSRTRRLLIPGPVAHFVHVAATCEYTRDEMCAGP